jgi:hypothetical protein
MPGQGPGKPPDWIPPGLRPEDEGLPADELHGDWYWGLDDGFVGAPATFQQASGGFYSIEWIVPAGWRLASAQLNPLITVKPHSNDGTLMTVEIESATNSSFTAGVVTTTLTNKASDVNVQSLIGPFTDLTTVYLRTRAGGGGNWSEWVGPVRLDLNSKIGNARQYVLLNNGYGAGTSWPEAIEWVQLNNGFPPLPSVGDAVEYVLEGDVNTDTPTPRIWGIFPTAGRSGDGFTIYGHGFGATAGTYSGIAVMEMSPDQTLSVSSWTQVAAGADAYNGNRKLDLSQSPVVITMEHQKIDVTVPTGAVPPGYPVRVDTNGA